MEDKVEDLILIDKHKVGLIIGKGGSNIKRF